MSNLRPEDTGRLLFSDRHLIRSSNGTLTCDVNGIVTSCESEGDDLQNILRFNLLEWRGYWGKPAVDDSLDILDLGYFYTKPGSSEEFYEKPDDDWRTQCAQEILQRRSEGRGKHDKRIKRANKAIKLYGELTGDPYDPGANLIDLLTDLMHRDAKRQEKNPANTTFADALRIAYGHFNTESGRIAPPIVKITVQGGCVQDVDDLPPGYLYEINDLDEREEEVDPPISDQQAAKAATEIARHQEGK